MNQPKQIIPRLSVIYNEIFIKSPYSLSDKPPEFWDEFFLFRPKTLELKKFLKNCDAEVLHFLASKCIQYTNCDDGQESLHQGHQAHENIKNPEDTKTRIRPKSLSLSTTSSTNSLTSIESKRLTHSFRNLSVLIQSTSHYPDFFELLFGCSDIFNDQIQDLLKNIDFILRKNFLFEDGVIESLLLCMNTCINCHVSEIEMVKFCQRNLRLQAAATAASNSNSDPNKQSLETGTQTLEQSNPFTKVFNNKPILDNLLNLLVTKRKSKNGNNNGSFGRYIISFISIMTLESNYSSSNNYPSDNHSFNAYKLYLTNLENQHQLVIIAAQILERLNDSVNRFLTSKSLFDGRKGLPQESLEKENQKEASASRSWLGSIFRSSNKSQTKTSSDSLKDSLALQNLNSTHKIHNIDNENIEILFLQELVNLNHHFVPMIFLISPEKFRFNCYDSSEILSPTVSSDSRTENLASNGGMVQDANFRRNSAVNNSGFEVEGVTGNSSSTALNQEQCLLSIFIEYTSIIMQNVRGLSTQNTTQNTVKASPSAEKSSKPRDSYNQTKICFTILANILQDNFACTEIFNTNNKFIVNIYKTPMRHRKQSNFKNSSFHEGFLSGGASVEVNNNRILASQKSLDSQVDGSEGNGNEGVVNQQNQQKSNLNNYKNSPLNQFINPNKPLAYWILNLCLEFMLSNLSRQNFPIEIYSRVLNVIHRLLVQMKKYEVRLTMLFPQLWHSLIILLKFIKNNHGHLTGSGSADNQTNTAAGTNPNIKQVLCSKNLLLVMKQALDIFNIFITFGDTFLQSAEQYDSLFYELIRLEDVFVSLEEFIESFRAADAAAGEQISSDMETSLDETSLTPRSSLARSSVSSASSTIESKILSNLSTNLLFSLKNIKDIISHFSPKIEQYRIKNKIPSLTESQVFKVVRENYHSLILCMNENLEMFENVDLIYNRNFTDVDCEEFLLGRSRVCLKYGMFEDLGYI